MNKQFVNIATTVQLLKQFANIIIKPFEIQNNKYVHIPNHCGPLQKIKSYLKLFLTNLNLLVQQHYSQSQPQITKKYLFATLPFMIQRNCKNQSTHSNKAQSVFLSQKKASTFVCSECSIFSTEQILVDYKEIQLIDKHNKNHKFSTNQKNLNHPQKHVKSNLQNSGKKSLKNHNKNSQQKVSNTRNCFRDNITCQKEIISPSTKYQMNSTHNQLNSIHYPFSETQCRVNSTQNQLSSTYYNLKQIKRSLNQNNTNTSFTLSASLNPSMFITRSGSGYLLPLYAQKNSKTTKHYYLNNKKIDLIREDPFIKIPMVESIKHQHIRNLSGRENLLYQTVVSLKNANLSKNVQPNKIYGNINKINVQQNQIYSPAKSIQIKPNTHPKIYNLQIFNPKTINPNQCHTQSMFSRTIELKQKLTQLPISPVKHIPIFEQSSGLNSYTITQRQSRTPSDQIKYKQMNNSVDKFRPPALNKQTSQDYSLNQKLTAINQLNYSREQIIQKQPSTENPKIFNLNHLNNALIAQKKQQSSLIPKGDEIPANERIITSQSHSIIQGQNYSILIQPDQMKQREITIQQQQLIKKLQEKNKQKQFGRHSAELPKLKRLNTFKVRKTISMRDQQSSSQEQTSQVIYGFRKLNNLQVMEDIQEDMQESMMTKIDQANNLTQTNKNFHIF